MSRNKVFILTALAITALLATFYMREVIQNKSATEHSQEQEHPQETPATGLWVSNTLSAHILGEILERDEDESSIQAIIEYSENVKEEGIDRGLQEPFDVMEVLLESGAIIESEGNYQAQIDIEEWNTDPKEGHEGSTIRQAMAAALDVTEVDWCANTIPADKFADFYLERHRDTSATKSEHLASIQEYVKCESGE
ncbi:hypothetical protein ACFW4K_11925 [Nocardiopsis alba]|uniref:hypothetical protein n=1 Tax=Nocardiopsis alba TaxID=53437 RepID=UPI00366A5997